MVRISKLVLQNFAGIYAGTHRKELEINFPKTKNKMIMLLGGNGSGKAQPLTSNVLSINGWIKMKDVNVGTMLFNPDQTESKYAEVTGVFPKGFLKLFKVNFSDSTSLECNDEHLFKVSVFDDSYCLFKDVVIELKEIKEYLSKGYEVVNSQIKLDKKSIKKNLVELRDIINNNELSITIDNHIVVNIIRNGYSRRLKDTIKYLGGTYIKLNNDTFKIFLPNDILDFTNIFSNKEFFFLPFNKSSLNVIPLEIFKPVQRRLHNQKFISIEDTNSEVEMMCIMLNSHNHTYVTDEMNVTHNTVILSQLSPYRDTNDERKSDILEGEKGYKEIWYEKGKHTFKIKHFYGNSSSQNKSFIEKDGKELNEKGNITTCYEIIERELSISRDYFTIGRLGSNVSNFIDLKTTDRKTYINKFVPNIDEFLNKFELVDDKYKKLDRKLKGIKLDLEKYPELDILEEIKKTNEDKLETIEKLKEKIITDKSSLTLKMESMNKELSDLYENSGLSELGISIEEFKNLDNLLEKYKVDLDQSNRVGNDLLNRFSSLASYGINKCNTSIEEFKESIIKNENEIELLNKDKYYLGKELFNLDTEIDDNKDKLESMKSKYNSDNEKILIKDKKESLESLNESLNDTIEEYNLNNVVLTSDINYSVIDDKVNTLLNAYSNMKESSPLSNEVVNYIDEILEKNNFNLDSVLDLINRNIKDNYNSLESEKNLFSDAQKDYMKVNSNSSLLKILEVSDHHDHVKDCPFVGMALSFEENSYNNIGDLEIKLDKLSKSIHKRETDIKYFYEIKEVISSWKTTLNNTFSSEDINSFIFDYLKMDIIDLTRLLTSSTIIIDKSINLNNGYKKAFIDVNNIIKIEEDIAKLEDKIEVSIRMENEMINISNNINVLELKKSEVSKSNLNISNKIQEMNKTSLKLNKQLEIVNKLLDHLVTKNEIEVILSKSEESLEKQKSLKKSIEENRRSVSDLIIEMDKNKEVEVSTRAKLDEVKQEIFLVTRNMKEMKAINSIISPLSKVRDSLNAKKGIPLVFINAYLKSISEKANELLSISYNDSFAIDFELNSKEFRIPVYKNDGTSLLDINGASQGEQSMTSLSLSMAMLSNIGVKYNVVYLDEVDGVLDEKNRSAFIKVVEKQLDELGSEQGFIISHNNYIDSSNIDLILLNGYESKIDINDKDIMNGKNIIYKNV